jgi:hypothetical protein
MLQKSVHDCLTFYLNNGTSTDVPANEADPHNSTEVRRQSLLEWLGPWNRGIGRSFPICTLASMLAETSSFCPGVIGLDDQKSSIFGSWRSSTPSQSDDLKKFILPDMRTNMRKVCDTLMYKPLWLLMSICYNAGIYNPYMGYGANAGFWHQIPPVLEAFIIHEISLQLDESRVMKLGLVPDKRPGNAYTSSRLRFYTTWPNASLNHALSMVCIS